MNKFSDNSVNCIVKAFQRGLYWHGEAIDSLDLVSSIQRNSYRAPEILRRCLKRLGGLIETGRWSSKESWIRDIKSNEDVDWSLPKWKKFIRILKKMSWQKLRTEGRSFLKIVEYLDEINEGGRAPRGWSWETLNPNMYVPDINTDWCLWEQDDNKIDIYSELLKFAYEHDLEDMVGHCMIILGRKILNWSENNSVDVFADLQRKAKTS